MQTELSHGQDIASETITEQDLIDERRYHFVCDVPVLSFSRWRHRRCILCSLALKFHRHF